MGGFWRGGLERGDLEGDLESKGSKGQKGKVRILTQRTLRKNTEGKKEKDRKKEESLTTQSKQRFAEKR